MAAISSVRPEEYLGLDPFSYDTRSKVAQAHGYDDYWHWARVFDVDQDFWYPFLAAYPGQGRTVLVFESRLGALSVALSREFSQVIAVHRNSPAAQQTESLLRFRGITNVETVIAPDVAAINIEQSFDAIIVFGLDQDLTGQWREMSVPVINRALQLARDHLNEQGQLVVGANNRWSYTGILGRVAGGDVAMPLALRAIRQVLPEISKFVGSSPLAGSHSPPPDMESMDLRKKAGSTGTGFGRMKAALLESRAFRQLWPSFIVVASRGPLVTRLSSVMHECRQKDGRTGEFQVGPTVKRYIAGNHGVTIAVASDRMAPDRDIVIRLARSGIARNYWRTNANALESLVGTGWQRLAPMLLGRLESDKECVSIESMCRGAECFADEPGFLDKLTSSIAGLVNLHSESTKLTVLQSEDFDTLVAPAIRDLQKFCIPEHRKRLSDIEDFLRTGLVGKTVCRGFMHGDFKLGNILFDRDGVPAGIIDWDGFEANGIQVFDYLTLVIYMVTHDFAIGHDGAFLGYVLRWTLPESYERCVRPAIDRLCPDPTSFLALRIAFWFTLLRTRYVPTFKIHPTWRERHIDAALPHIESMLGMGDQPGTERNPPA